MVGPLPFRQRLHIRHNGNHVDRFPFLSRRSEIHLDPLDVGISHGRFFHELHGKLGEAVRRSHRRRMDGKTIRLRFVMKDADIYSIQFRQ